MAKNIAREGAENAVAYNGSWTGSVYIYAGASGTITGIPAKQTTAVDVPVSKGQVPQILFSSVSAAPTGSLAIW